MKLKQDTAISYAVVHLLRTVEHVDHDAECSAEVFGRLSLSSTCRSSRCPTHRQVQRLCQGYVTSGKASDNKHTLKRITLLCLTKTSTIHT